LIKANPPRKRELKQLPSHLKYVFLAENGEKLIIISNFFNSRRGAVGDKGVESK